ncbi:MAG: single-stranded DNA-binding protein, partial [Planctomycetes bacterium]|nr:single-stranded DNA-binding protein [Planctomycetota bacterium]
MANLNKVFLIGNLTRDPELRYTQGGTALAKFGMAINRQYTNKASGEKVENTCFVDLTAWGKPAEIINQYMSKGRQMFVEGRLDLNQWEDRQTGQKRSKLSVVVEN